MVTLFKFTSVHCVQATSAHDARNVERNETKVSNVTTLTIATRFTELIFILSGILPLPEIISM